MTKKTKTISIIFLAIWSVLLVVILTFGGNFSLFIQAKISNYLIQKKGNNQTMVTDLDVKIEDTYIVGKKYPIVVNPIPYTEEDLKLTYRSLDESIFTINDQGEIVGVKTPLSKTTGILEITSARYPALKKQVELQFEKVYPKDVDFKLIKPVNENANQIAYLGVPFYVKCLFDNDDAPYTVPSYTIIYDEEMIEKVNVNKYIPQKTGTTTLVCKLENGVEKSVEVHIQTNPSEFETIDQVKLVQKNGEEFPIDEDVYLAYVGDKNVIHLLSNEKRIYESFSLQSSDAKIASISNIDELVFKKAGQVEITLVLRDGNEFHLQVLVKHPLISPTIDGVTDDTISLTNEIAKRFTYQVGANAPVRFSYDKQYMVVTNDKNNTMYITPKKAGTTTLTIVVDDGVDHLEKEYQIVIAQNNLGKKTIRQKVAIFINKFIGHWHLFLIEAILAFWVCLHFPNHKAINCILFISTGCFLAFFTELIQLYMPNRNGCIKDALFDILAYFLCAGVCFLIYLIHKKKKLKKSKVEERG